MICGYCKQDKELNEFGPRPDSKYTTRSWWCRSCDRNRVNARNHGLTYDQKLKIAAYQCGCTICGHWNPGDKGWTVDHDHTCCNKSASCTECRRGVICSFCNKMLGFAFDRKEILQAAIEYLESHAAGTCDWHRPVACSKAICGKIAAA